MGAINFGGGAVPLLGPGASHLIQEKITDGHGGTDWMTMRGFIEAVRHKTQTPLTVYDAASWSVVAPLSEKSVASDSERVNFPDFYTRQLEEYAEVRDERQLRAEVLLDV